MDKVKQVKASRVVAFLKGPARWPLWVLCVAMGAGGAVNEGFSGWAMFIPFAFLMWGLAWLGDQSQAERMLGKLDRTKRRCWERRVCVVMFWALVVAVSGTQYKNPWIYPILDMGYVTALTDGKIGLHEGLVKSPPFLDALNLAGLEGGGNYKELRRYTKGTIFRVVGIYGDMGDLYQKVGLVLSDGQTEFTVTERNWTERSPELLARDGTGKMGILLAQKVKPSKTVQAPWAKGLGLLMLWPVGPLLVFK